MQRYVVRNPWLRARRGYGTSSPSPSWRTQPSPPGSNYLHFYWLLWNLVLIRGGVAWCPKFYFFIFERKLTIFKFLHGTSELSLTQISHLPVIETNEHQNFSYNIGESWSWKYTLWTISCIMWKVFIIQLFYYKISKINAFFADQTYIRYVVQCILF